jgi:outer membrane protein, heavy metal efflux system
MGPTIQPFPERASTARAIPVRIGRAVVITAGAITARASTVSIGTALQGRALQGEALQTAALPVTAPRIGMPGSRRMSIITEPGRSARVLTALAVLALGALPIGACGPSRADLFDPVTRAVYERTAVVPEWRFGQERSVATERKLRRLLSRPMTADSAAALAILNSSQLQAAYAELSAAGASQSGASTLPNPELEAELTFPLEGGDDPHLEFSALQDISALIAMIPSERAADADVRAARRRAVEATVAIAARARVAFYDAAAAEQALRLRRVSLATAEAAAALARSLRAAGNITELALLRESVVEQEARVALGEAETRAKVQREALNALLGLHGEQLAWRLEAELASPPTVIVSGSDLERDAVAASLELDALRWSLRSAGHGVAAARLQSFLPHVGVGIAVKREEQWSAGPALSLSLPLFDWGSAKRDAAWARVHGLQHRYTALAVTTRAAARSAAARLSSVHARVLQLSSSILPMREQLVDQAVRQYNAMNVDAFQLLVLRREQVSAQERYIAALRDYWVTQSDVDQLRAGSLPAGSLTSSPEVSAAAEAGSGARH